MGQNPGQEEDKANEVFVGPSGKLLIDHIRKFKLTPARLTNTVRCMTPEDRAPTDAEIKACRGYLKAEVEEFRPEFLVAVGGTALALLTKKTGISFWSGRLAGQVSKIPVLALIHPSYVLRSGSYDNFRTDFVSLRTVADTISAFKKSFPEADIADAVGFTDSIPLTQEDREQAEMIKFKGRMRAQMVEQVPRLLKKVKKVPREVKIDGHN